MDYDLSSNIIGLPALEYATYSADQAPAVFNHASHGNFKGLTIGIEIGVGGITFDATNRIDLKLQHSDDGVTYVDVTDDDVILPYGLSVASGGIVKSLVAAHAAADVTYITYRGKKQYVKPAVDFAGTHAVGTPIGIHYLLHHPISKPVWNASVPDMV